MRLAYDIHSMKGESLTRDIPVYGTLAEGALLIAGTTTGASTAIIGAAPYTNAIGMINEAITASGTVAAGTFSYAKTVIGPGAVFEASFSLDGDTNHNLAAVSGVTNTITVGTSDDHFDGGWVYVATGTGAGQLFYITAADTTTYTTKTTIGTALDATSYLVLIPGGFGPADVASAAVGNNLDLDSTGVYAISDENATGCFALLRRFIKYDGIGKSELRIASHDGLTGLNLKNVELSIEIMPMKHIMGRPNPS